MGTAAGHAMIFLAASDPATAPTWITALATVALVIGAGLTVYFAKRAFDKQAAALNELTRQVNDQLDTNVKLREAAGRQVDEINASLSRLEQENEARRRAQATQIHLWTTTSAGTTSIGWAASTEPPPPSRTVAHVRNTSGRPVYKLGLTWKIGAAELPPVSEIQTLLPGEEKTEERDTHPGVVYDTFGPDLQFTDADGVRWLLTLGGALSEVPTSGSSAAAGPAV